MAGCEAKLGNADRARAQLDPLLADWDAPDPGSPVRREAEALRATLSSSPLPH
jgi:hypothetical protein